MIFEKWEKKIYHLYASPMDTIVSLSISLVQWVCAKQGQEAEQLVIYLTQHQQLSLKVTCLLMS